MQNKTYLVKVTALAEEQIREIYSYIKTDLNNPNAAEALLDAIIKAASSLSQIPYRIAPIQEEPWRNIGIRKIPVSSYYIYFWVDEDKSKVQIIAVIYSKRDQKKQLLQIDFN